MQKNPKKFIPVTGPWITEREVRYVAKAARDGWDENAAKYVNLFEERFAKYIGRKYALATSSCTGALHLSYLALGIRSGDEVIAPNLTWIASVEPLYYIGANLVYADVDKKTWCIDPRDVLRKITRKTKAIIVVDLYGQMPAMREIEKIARKHKLKIIEDAAEALGSTYEGKLAGSFGDVSCFSFHGSKTMVTGEGGMLLTDSAEIAKRARYYNDHCKDPKKLYWNLEIGYKYKMSNFQAACGLAQLERVHELIQKKREIFSWYYKRLAKIPGIQISGKPSQRGIVNWMVNVLYDKRFSIGKEELTDNMAIFGIQTRPVFYPISKLPAVHSNDITPVADDISSRAINLPSGLRLMEKDVDFVVKMLLKVLADHE